MSGWTGIQKIKGKETQVVAAVTATPVVLSEPISLTAGGASRAFRIEVDVSAVDSLVAGVISIRQRVGSVMVVAKSTAAFTTTGTKVILMHEVVDYAILPLNALCDIVVTGTSGGLTVTSVKVYQET